MFLTLITFVIILGILVFFHEIGHFISAKKLGVKVEEFGFGFPPRVIGLYKNHDTNKWKIVGPKIKTAPATIYSFNWIPLGGFVKIKGEQGENSQDKDSFGHQSVGRRIWIVSAGVLMNIFLAYILFSIGLMIGLPQVIEEADLSKAKVRERKIQITQIIESSPAEKAGLEFGDTILSIDGQYFFKIDAVKDYLDKKIGAEVTLNILRDKKIVSYQITPELISIIDRGGIGVGLAETGIVSYPWYWSLVKGGQLTLFLIKEIVSAFYSLIKDLIIVKKVTIDFAGPVGIAVLTGRVARLGLIYILQFTALLSLNLAVINFLPFPALDGGRALFLVVEKLRGKAINQKVEAIIHNTGFILLLILVVLVTYRDIFRFSEKFSALWQKIINIF